MVSIIVPVYNVEKYLSHCIDSILIQTYKNIEIILVDDGSTDRSGYICDDYKRKEDRIVVIHKKNGGLSSARNAGLEIAHGEYISFVDSDDWIAPEFIETHIQNIKKSNADISICRYWNIKERNIKAIQERKGKEFCILTKEEAIDSMFIYNKFQSQVWCMVFKRELFDDIKFPYGRTYEDQAVTYKLIWESTRIVFTNEKLYYYYYNPNGICLSYKDRRDLLLAYDESIDFFKEKYPRIVKYIGYIWVSMYLRQYCNAISTYYIEFFRAEYRKFKIRSKGFIFSKSVSNRSRILYLSFVFLNEKGLKVFKSCVK